MFARFLNKQTHFNEISPSMVRSCHTKSSKNKKLKWGMPSPSFLVSSHCSRTFMSATPCTWVSCLQSRDATSFLGPGWEGMKCSVSVTVEWPPTSLKERGRHIWLKLITVGEKNEMVNRGCNLTLFLLHDPFEGPGPPLWTQRPSVYTAEGWWRWSWLTSPSQLQHHPQAANKKEQN